MDEILIARIRKRALNAATRTDMAASTIRRPATQDELETAERDLGFALPLALKEVYQMVGNGGFGPGYGLMGIGTGFRDDVGDDIVSGYRSFVTNDSTWPAQLLRICHWGCAIYSCIDCADNSIKVWDPNNWNDGQPADTAIRIEAMSFEQWISDWADGKILWDNITEVISAIVQRQSDGLAT